MHVAIADDDSIVCSSLSTILEATGTADVAWTANTGTDAVTQYEMDAPDVLLVDVQMPGMDGLQASEAILDAHPNARILILTTFADESYIAKALEIGTKGYLIKQDVSSVIPAVQAVMAGQVVMGAEVLSKLRVSPQSTTSDESSSVDRVVSHDDAQAVQGFRDPIPADHPNVSPALPNANWTCWNLWPRDWTIVRSRHGCFSAKARSATASATYLPKPTSPIAPNSPSNGWPGIDRLNPVD